MSKIVRNKPITIEFGCYDNFRTMIPIEILEYKPNESYGVLIRWQYPNSDKTIDLWAYNAENVDFDSFKQKIKGVER